MVIPAEVAAAVHKLFCEDNLIPRGKRKPHDLMSHLDTSTLYADAVNEAGLSVGGDEVANAIAITSGWDGYEPNTFRHPSPDDVVNHLIFKA